MAGAAFVPEISCLYLATAKSGIQLVGGVIVVGHCGVGQGVGA